MRYHVGIGCSFGTSSHNVHGILANKIGSEFINLSSPGLGNFFMLSEIMFWISSNKDKIMNTTFSIGLSGIYRNDLITDTPNLGDPKERHRGFHWTSWRGDRADDEKDRGLGGGHTAKHLPDKVNSRLDHTIRYLVYVIAIQKLLDSHGCRYLLFNAIDNYVNKLDFTTSQASRILTLEKQINNTNFYNMQESQLNFIGKHKFFKDPTPASLQRKILNWPTDDNQFLVKDAHPSEEGDKKWSELLWTFSKDNRIF